MAIHFTQPRLYSVRLFPLQHILFVSTSQIQLRRKVVPCVVRPTIDFHLKTKRDGNSRVLNSSPRGICVSVILGSVSPYSAFCLLTAGSQSQGSVETETHLTLMYVEIGVVIEICIGVEKYIIGCKLNLCYWCACPGKIHYHAIAKVILVTEFKLT